MARGLKVNARDNCAVLLTDVKKGEPARAELLGHDELFCITRI